MVTDNFFDKNIKRFFILSLFDENIVFDEDGKKYSFLKNKKKSRLMVLEGGLRGHSLKEGKCARTNSSYTTAAVSVVSNGTKIIISGRANHLKSKLKIL